jgi:hypothetical protein
MDDADQRSQTFTEFCQGERISKTTLYGLLRRGLGPEVLEVPGTKIKRITPEAREAWHARMAELAKTESSRLEAERRRELAAIAGKRAAESPRHVSRKKAASTTTAAGAQHKRRRV